MTECSSEQLSFQGIGSRRVEGRFDGKKLSSDGGAMLFREVCKKRSLFSRFASCFTDHRCPVQSTYTVQTLLEQRIYGLLCGYEDLNDHDTIRHDPILQLLTESPDARLASHSTLNRVELSSRTGGKASRYHKILCDEDEVRELFLREFIEYARKHHTSNLFIIDFDATDIPLHGKQEDGHYHGYYGHYCYLPLYAFCDGFPLWAELRPSNIDGSLGTEAALEKIVTSLRKYFPDARILLRGDSGFCREAIMAFCEAHKIDYLLGIARNNRLEGRISQEMKRAKALFEKTGESARVYRECRYKTLNSWSKTRRVVGKAEYLAKGENPRFVVTSLSKKEYDAATLYEKLYCKRGDAENRIKEQFQLFAGRTSAHITQGNQMRLWFSAFAYLIMHLAKKTLLRGTEAASMEPNTLRSKLIKVAVQVKISARRVYLSFAENCPFQHLFQKALAPPA